VLFRSHGKEMAGDQQEAADGVGAKACGLARELQELNSLVRMAKGKHEAGAANPDASGQHARESGSANSSVMADEGLSDASASSPSMPVDLRTKLQNQARQLSQLRKQAGHSAPQSDHVESGVPSTSKTPGGGKSNSLLELLQSQREKLLGGRADDAYDPTMQQQQQQEHVGHVRRHDDDDDDDDAWMALNKPSFILSSRQETAVDGVVKSVDGVVQSVDGDGVIMGVTAEVVFGNDDRGVRACGAVLNSVAALHDVIEGAAALPRGDEDAKTKSGQDDKGLTGVFSRVFFCLCLCVIVCPRFIG